MISPSSFGRSSPPGRAVPGVWRISCPPPRYAVPWCITPKHMTARFTASADDILTCASATRASLSFRRLPPILIASALKGYHKGLLESRFCFFFEPLFHRLKALPTESPERTFRETSTGLLMPKAHQALQRGVSTLQDKRMRKCYPAFGDLLARQLCRHHPRRTENFLLPPPHDDVVRRGTGFDVPRS